ncbi:surface-adhesin E family protein [Allocoleopsis franciscana]|uniref:surface-adhesin E family protein n=1 Tax=Allocoleopsis franciscana TaxID=2886352 RepID=UPI0012DEA02D|nr:surface-adhesin E family protein [Allocoleopsis franciscana]
MPRILFLVFFASLMTALPALAENWVLVTRDEQGTDYYIDTESVQGSNGTYLFWRMAVRAKPDEMGIVAEKTFVSMSCPLQGWRRKAVARFNAQSELVNREEFGENEPLQFFMDGTVGQRLWKFVCR